MNPKHARRIVVVLSGIMVAVCLILSGTVVPTTRAYAKSYSIDKVDIQAQLDNQGTLHVLEKRTFDFNGKFNGVYWQTTRGTNPSNGSTVDVQILNAGIVGPNGELQPFSKNNASDNGYAVSPTSNYVKTTLYSKQRDTTATFYVEYTATNLAVNYADTAELYWKFVEPGWEKDSHNVTLSLTLPAPEGTKLSDADTVRVWGHGPLDGDVQKATHTIEYTIPQVDSGTFAEARVLFPSAWLSGVAQSTDAKFDSIVAEEQGYADAANARRQQVRIIAYTVVGVVTVLGLVTILYGLFVYRKTKREQRTVFTDPYLRDIPLSTHPLLQATVYYMGEGNYADATVYEPFFSANILRLTDLHVLRIETQEKQRMLSLLKNKTVHILYQQKELDRSWYKDEASYKIDQAFLKVLFSQNDPVLADQQGALAAVELDNVGHASRDDEDFRSLVQDWLGASHGPALQKYSGPGRADKRGLLITLIALCVMGAVGVLILTFNTTPLMALGIIPPIGGVLVGLMAYFVRIDLTSEGLELHAQLTALRHWFKEFTRLEESVPQDVILWNRLLVMAAALGVAEEVIKQLEVSFPELVQDPMFYPMYWWYLTPVHGGRAPMSITRSAAHDSFSRAFSSSTSSGGGFGGGFSGGGGGGFGGSGGGGAF